MKTGKAIVILVLLVIIFLLLFIITVDVILNRLSFVAG